MANSKRLCKGCNRYLRQDKHNWFRAPNGSYYHTRGCAAISLRKGLQKKYADEAKAKRAKRKKQLAESKPINHWLKLTQRAVNKYVLTRDKDLPCISCGIKPHEISTESLTGSEWHAGHFKTVGAHSELRFDTRNINKQCATCNLHYSGRIDGYKEGVIARFGQERLDWLMGNRHEIKKYDLDYLARVRSVFSKKTRLLIKRGK